MYKKSDEYESTHLQHCWNMYWSGCRSCNIQWLITNKSIAIITLPISTISDATILNVNLNSASWKIRWRYTIKLVHKFGQFVYWHHQCGRGHNLIRRTQSTYTTCFPDFCYMCSVKCSMIELEAFCNFFAKSLTDTWYQVRGLIYCSPSRFHSRIQSKSKEFVFI